MTTPCTHPDWKFPKPYPAEGDVCRWCGAVWSAPLKVPADIERYQAFVEIVGLGVELEEGNLTPVEKRRLRRKITDIATHNGLEWVLVGGEK